MTLVNIDLRNQGYETGPDDRVVFYSLLVREGDFGTISTAPVEVMLTDGKATVDLAPGPVGVQILAGQVADTRVKIGEVPPSGPTTLGAVMMVTPAYTPALQAAMIAAIERAKDTAVRQVDAEVAQAVDAEVGEFKTKAEQALTKSTAAESKSDTALSKSTTAESSAGNAVSRVEALEVMGGLTPGEPADGQTANLIEQPDTLTRNAVERATDVSMGARNLTTYGTKIYEGEATGEVVTLAAAPRADVSIATALPDVTLAQVKSLDPDADLTDSADWYLLQSLISDCATRLVKAIKIPRGRYYLSRGVDLTALEFGTHIDAAGVMWWATRKMPWMLKLHPASGVYWKARQLQITGLDLRGNYVAHTGVVIRNAQEWYLDVKVHGCYVAVSLSDTWYGAFSPTCTIINCLVGLSFDVGNFAEVNTVQIPNLKINFASEKSNFPDAENTDSIGIRISTILGGIHFDAPVVEGVDYGVKYVPVRTGSGSSGGLATFTAAYWEAIKKRVFDFSEYAQPGYTHMYISMNIQGNRFHAPAAMESVFGPGSHVIEKGQKHKIRIMDSPPTRITMRIDDTVDLVQAPVNPQVFIDRTPTVPTNVYTERFSAWGNTNAYPQGEAMLHTTEHAGYKTVPSMERLRGTASVSTSKITPTYNITGRPTVYLPGLGDTPNGPVVRGVDGWYMILLGDDGSLTTRRVKNTQRLDEGTNSRTGKELYHMAATALVGSVYRCIDFNQDVTLALVEGQRRWVDASNRLRIGTTEELLLAATSTPNGIFVYDVSTGQAAQVWNGALNLYDWFGDIQGRIAGPPASRPNTPTAGLIYYDTEAKTYTKYQDGAWINFTPNPTA